MNRIASAFQNRKAVIGFLTGGDPTQKMSFDLLTAMIRGGIDLMEIGIPFSDPIADGPVIQNANRRALEAGTRVETIFQLVAKIRETSSIPIVLMTSFNPVLNFGLDPFFRRMADVGADGIIIPDLPLEEMTEITPFTEKNGIAVIGMVAPTSGSERIRKIAASSSGFVYAVSSNGVTGRRGEITTDLSGMITEIRKTSDLPVAIGFGIQTPRQAEKIAKFADGVIVGSAFVHLIEEAMDTNRDAAERIENFARELKTAIKTD